MFPEKCAARGGASKRAKQLRCGVILLHDPVPCKTVEAVDDYCRRGWFVFPVVEGTKDKPRVKWREASINDPETVSRFFRPGDNIGLDCGKSEVVVVDLDRHDKKRDGFATWERLKELYLFDDAGALRSRTGSGGLHLIFTDTLGKKVRNSQGMLGPGIDVRGEGGCIVLPPSRHPNGTRYRYEGDWNREPGLLPAALEELLIEPSSWIQPAGVTDTTLRGGEDRICNTSPAFPTKLDRNIWEIQHGAPRPGRRHALLVQGGLLLTSRKMWGEEGLDKLRSWIVRATEVSPAKTAERLREVERLWRYDAKRLRDGLIQPMIGRAAPIALTERQNKIIADAVRDLSLRRDSTKADLLALIPVFVGQALAVSSSGEQIFWLATRDAAQFAFGRREDSVKVSRLAQYFIDSELWVFETVRPATPYRAPRLKLCEPWRERLTR